LSRGRRFAAVLGRDRFESVFRLFPINWPPLCFLLLPLLVYYVLISIQCVLWPIALMASVKDFFCRLLLDDEVIWKRIPWMARGAPPESAVRLSLDSLLQTVGRLVGSLMPINQSRPEPLERSRRRRRRTAAVRGWFGDWRHERVEEHFHEEGGSMSRSFRNLSMDKGHRSSFATDLSGFASILERGLSIERCPVTRVDERAGPGPAVLKTIYRDEREIEQNLRFSDRQSQKGPRSRNNGRRELVARISPRL
jgi:hypothetical protein